VDLFICGYVKIQFHKDEQNKSSLQYSTLVPFMLNRQRTHRSENFFFTTTVMARSQKSRNRREWTTPMGAVFRLHGMTSTATDGPISIVANDLWGSKLYLNLHNGKFKDVTRRRGVRFPR